VWGDIPPDPSILWAGNDIQVYHSSTNPSAIAQLIFWTTSGAGQLGQSNASYSQELSTLYAGWVDHENPTAGAYWMRVRQTDDQSFIDPGQEFSITDGSGTPRNLGDEFDPRNTVIRIITTTGIPPTVSYITLYIDICKDDGGSPDGNWATRVVTIALEFII